MSLSEQDAIKLTARARSLYNEAEKLGLVYEGNPCPTEDMVREELYLVASESASPLIDHIDLMRDEFLRIRALHYGDSPHEREIVGLCDRAIRETEQKVPVIAQRDTYNRELAETKAELEKAKDRSWGLKCSVVRLEDQLTAYKIARCAANGGKQP